MCIRDRISLGHANTSVNDSEGVVILVGDDSNLHLFLRVKHRWIGETLVADLVQCLCFVKKKVRGSLIQSPCYNSNP